jgi:hypothetical protein
MGPTALPPLRRKAYCRISSPSVGFEARTLGPMASTLTITPPRTTFHFVFVEAVYTKGYTQWFVWCSSWLLQIYVYSAWISLTFLLLFNQVSLPYTSVVSVLTFPYFLYFKQEFHNMVGASTTVKIPPVCPCLCAMYCRESGLALVLISVLQFQRCKRQAMLPSYLTHIRRTKALPSVLVPTGGSCGLHVRPSILKSRLETHDFKHWDAQYKNEFVLLTNSVGLL